MTPILIDIAWGLFGAMCALGWEVLARTTNWAWWKVILAGLPFQAGIGISVYHLMNRAPHFLGGILWFTATVWLGRALLSTLYFAEAVPVRTWVACGIVVAASVYDKTIG